MLKTLVHFVLEIMKDYYDTLGISRDATDETIKKTYRQLALKFHPDRNAGNKEAENKFKEINEAYSVLSNSQKRANYDRYGTAEGVGEFSDFGPFSSSFSGIFEDIFGDFFGGSPFGQRRTRVAKGDDLRYDLNISFDESAFGAEKEIEVSRWLRCESCHGTRSANGKEPLTCPDCHGSGQMRFQQGFFSVSKTCTKCNGDGSIIVDPCKKCRGSGRIRKKREVLVKVPPGVDTGVRLKMTGEGELGQHGGPPGDLYIYILVERHPLFVREDINIICEIPVSFTTATLGGEINVPTLKGSEKIKVPSGTPSGKIFRLKGQGIQQLGRFTRGDQIVKIYIDVPRKLTQKQRELLEEFANISGDNHSTSFKDKLKNIFTHHE